MKANREARRPLGGRRRWLVVVLALVTCLVAGAGVFSLTRGSKKSVGGADGDTPRVAAGGSGQPNAASTGEHSRQPGGDDYRAIDRHALSIPKAAEQSIETLAANLVKPAKDDREKVRAIFRWVADRIAYDTSFSFEQEAEVVLQRRTGVCQGYANLFQELCAGAGVEAAVIGGTARGGGLIDRHAWNAVKLDGAWRLVDVTWAAGCLREDKYCKDFKEIFYLAAPEQMILDHFPDDPAWQLLDPPVTAEDYQELRKLKPGMRPLAGRHHELLEKLRDPMFRGFVTVLCPAELGHDDPRYVVRHAPLSKYLRAGRKQWFQIESAVFEEVAIRTGGEFQFLGRNGNRFEGQVIFAKGPAVVCARQAGQRGLAPILEYVAE